MEQVVLYVFVVVPFLALAAVVPAVWGWGLSWLDVADGRGLLLLHAARGDGRLPPVLHPWLVQGRPPVEPRARRDRRGWLQGRSSSGSPTTAGTTPSATARATRPWRDCATTPGHWSRACSTRTWLFDRRQANAARYAPDLLKDKGLRRQPDVQRFWAFLSFALPPLIGGLVTHSWMGATWSAFLWAAWCASPSSTMVDQLGLPRRRQPASPGPRPRDQLLAAGGSGRIVRHNLHHADPTCARHGVLRGQIDISARVIWLFERLGWARDGSGPTPSGSPRRSGRPSVTS